MSLDSPLHAAAFRGCINWVLTILKSGENPNNRRVFDNYTPLMVASSRGFSKIARILLDNGALVDLVNNYGASALALAVAMEYVETVKLLIRYGRADVDIACSRGWTPLNVAVCKNNINRIYWCFIKAFSIVEFI